MKPETGWQSSRKKHKNRSALAHVRHTGLFMPPAYNRHMLLISMALVWFSASGPMQPYNNCALPKLTRRPLVAVTPEVAVSSPSSASSSTDPMADIGKGHTPIHHRALAAWAINQVELTNTLQLCDKTHADRSPFGVELADLYKRSIRP